MNDVNFCAILFVKYFCYCVEFLPALSIGLHLTYATIALPAHKREDAKIQFDHEIGSWFASLFFISLLTGSVSCSGLVGRFGRRTALFIANLLVVIGCASLAFAPSYHLLLIGRSIAGIGCGINFPASMLFLHETGIPKHRPVLASLNILFINLGCLLCLVSGWALPYKFQPYIAATPSILLCLTIYVLPESPTWLLQRYQEEKAKLSLIKLWNDPVSAEKEIKSLHVNLEAKSEKSFWSKEYQKKLLTFQNIKLLCTISLLMTLTSLTGSDTMYNYSIIICQMVGLEVNHNLFSILLQSGCTIGNVLGSYLIVRIPRKVHLNIGLSLLGLSCGLLGLGLYRPSNGEKMNEVVDLILHEVLPTGSVLAFGLIHGSSVGPIPFAFCGEMLPESIHNIGTSITIFFKYGSAFILLKQFPYMADLFGLHGLFWFHAACCLVGIIFVQICVPETNTKFCVQKDEEKGIKVNEKSDKSDLNKEKC